MVAHKHDAQGRPNHRCPQWAYNARLDAIGANPKSKKFEWVDYYDKRTGEKTR